MQRASKQASDAAIAAMIAEKLLRGSELAVVISSVSLVDGQKCECRMRPTPATPGARAARKANLSDQTSLMYVPLRLAMYVRFLADREHDSRRSSIRSSSVWSPRP